ncbi:hypothetical protein [Haloterrigena alkaliphila]|uniref:Uncharacterized protein n=1 Tax=Haloterrigena alkaliphila TaxID=2816475 RepID=A0A8A2VJ96_9EURY|nr:hypothetical protein [Haloterrigena alkaliphila]QSX00403.1 hypothetical protein J0X25_05395 [Haloterrigena alkaliphila]
MFVVLALGSVAATSPGDGASDRRQPMVSAGDDSSLWPYTSPTTAFEDRTLAINVLVSGDPAETRRHLEERSDGEWNETAPEEEDVSDAGTDERVGTSTAWGTADGSTRYLYATTDGDPSGGRWIDESYQLHDGDYLGSRHHIRAYESPDPDDEWTAIQAHGEHWDWFRLSHTVDSVERSQQYVEREFMGRHYVTDVTRVHLGNDRGSDADGWVTIVDLDGGDPPFHLAFLGLLPGAMLATRVSSRNPLDALVAARVPRALLLAGSLIALYFFVRFGAIAVETRLHGVDPRFIAGAFYPFLAVGLPVCTYYFARSLDRPTAFAAGSIGFATAILLDYTVLGVTRLPVNVFVHRFSTAIALGFIAVGASHTVRVDPEDHDFVRLGALLWMVTLLVPLLRFL